MTASPSPPTQVAGRGDRFARVVAVLVGLVFVAAGAWAFATPYSFFDAAATFEPFNTHLIRDIGAFQLGLGAVLLLAVVVRDALLAALTGVAVGAVFHLLAHVIDRDLGGDPTVDIPQFAIIAALLVAAAVVRARTRRPGGH